MVKMNYKHFTVVAAIFVFVGMMFIAPVSAAPTPTVQASLPAVKASAKGTCFTLSAIEASKGMSKG